MKHLQPSYGSLASAARRIRIAARAATSVAVAALYVAGCSSGSTGTGLPCDTVYKGECGLSCTLDTDCKDGLYCGAPGCTADCSANHACDNGYVCADRGRCVAEDNNMIGGVDGGSSSGGGLTSKNACVNDRRSGEGLPADIYIMNDQSASMTCTVPGGTDRWNAMKSAISGFLKSPDATGLGVGIQYFGIKTGKGPFVGGGRGGDTSSGSCNPADYTTAAIEIAPLPGNATPIINSLNAATPTTYTPTPAALQGAIDHAKVWATAHPDHAVSVVLATDGEPNASLDGNACATAGQNRAQIQALLTQVAKIAADGFSGTPKIPTYVIGIVGGAGSCNLDPAPPNAADLNSIAKAGGTSTAYIVDATAANTSAQFLDALNRIRGAAVVPCEYVVPLTSVDGQSVDPSKVNITLTPSGGKEQELFQAADAAHCASQGGWYYIDATQKKIELCPTSCNVVKADAKAAVQVLLGCVTDTGPIQ